MSLYVQVPIQQIADGLTAIGWSSAGGGGDATLSYGSTVPATPVNGTLWYDTTATLLKLYTGGTWTTINVSAETISTIQGYVTSAQASANTATQKLTEFKAIQVTATTLSAGASATASFNSGTGVITLGIPTGATGIKGADGEVSTAQLNTAISGITKTSLGLSNVDNTSDANKPISTATQTALNLKADATVLSTKQDTLVSGVNIKTVGGSSILGSGDISAGVNAYYQEFTTSGTWTKPAGCNFVYVEAIGGGGGGGNNTNNNASVGSGGGGAGVSKLLLASSLSSSISVTIGAGGSGTPNDSTVKASDGGATSFGAYLTANGGFGGVISSVNDDFFKYKYSAGGSDIKPIFINSSSASGNGGYSSGSGCYGYQKGGNSVIGGAGGGGPMDSYYGLSIFGGNGGNGNSTLNTKAGDGAVGGGGGGASANNGGGGNGGNGVVRVWAW